jgi:hypothetical protein
MDEALVFQGGIAKSLDERQYLVLFSSENDPDASRYRNFFTKSTDFGFGERDRIETAIYYDHGKHSALKKQQIGRGALGMDEVGVFIEGELDRRNKYVRGIKQLLDKGALGWSSGTAVHLVETKGANFEGEVTKWPLGLDASLTPTPAEPRTRAVGLKSLGAAKSLEALLEDHGIEVEDDEPDAVKAEPAPLPEGGVTLTEDTSRALDAVRRVNARWLAIAESDAAVKVGAKLTKSRRERVAAWRDELRALAEQAEELLSETEPAKAEQPEAATETPAPATPSTASLRNQSLRLASQAALLAR